MKWLNISLHTLSHRAGVSTGNLVTRDARIHKPDVQVGISSEDKVLDKTSVEPLRTNTIAIKYDSFSILQRKLLGRKSRACSYKQACDPATQCDSELMY
jgi:hypothetical protein